MDNKEIEWFWEIFRNLTEDIINQEQSKKTIQEKRRDYPMDAIQ